ncbi:cell division protein FtsZ homolog 2-2, chloroplastic-like isoform X1 [Miscanthus floridulus]|uniref:cell division protein FtsZ homolog 2-2, chloroplastic-like isoform X1 n=1 Tax=Miscanthus floridulus TaxID=154761 RepID=UPI00345960F1
MERMQWLGILDLAHTLSQSAAASGSGRWRRKPVEPGSVDAARVKPAPPPPSRRSLRLKDVEPVSYCETEPKKEKPGVHSGMLFLAGMGGGTGAFVIPNVPGLVNVDFADVRAIMQNAGSSLMGIGTATGKSRARDAALNAIQSPLLDIGIERATGIVWNITGGTDLTLFEVSITLIATGFKRQDEPEGRASKGGQQGENGRRPSSAEGSMVEIPEFLRRRRPSRFPRV